MQDWQFMGDLGTSLFSLLWGEKNKQEGIAATQPWVNKLTSSEFTKPEQSLFGTDSAQWANTGKMSAASMNPAYLKAGIDAGVFRQEGDTVHYLQKPSVNQFGQLSLSTAANQFNAEQKWADRLKGQVEQAQSAIRGQQANLAQVPDQIDRTRLAGLEGMQREQAAIQGAQKAQYQQGLQQLAQARTDISRGIQASQAQIAQTLAAVAANNYQTLAGLSETFSGLSQAAMQSADINARASLMEIDGAMPEGASSAVKELRLNIAEQEKRNTWSTLANQFGQHIGEIRTALTQTQNSITGQLGALQAQQEAAGGQAKAALGTQGAELGLAYSQLQAQTGTFFSQLKTNWNASMAAAKANAQGMLAQYVADTEQGLVAAWSAVPETFVNIMQPFAEILGFTSGIEDLKYNRNVQAFNTVASQFNLTQAAAQPYTQFALSMLGQAFTPGGVGGGGGNSFAPYGAAGIGAAGAMGSAALLAGGGTAAGTALAPGAALAAGGATLSAAAGGAGAGFAAMGPGMVASKIVVLVCVDANARVQVPGGWRQLKALKVGDVVLNADGSPRRITRYDCGMPWPERAQDFVEIEAGNQRLVCTKDHVINGRPAGTWATVLPHEPIECGDLRLEDGSDYVANGFRVTSMFDKVEAGGGECRS